MATSGVTTFDLDVVSLIEEAFERCGTEARTGYDLRTARRSLNLLLAEWANRGLNQWTITTSSLALTSGTSSYALGAATIDVLSPIVLRKDSGTTNQLDTEILRVSRGEWVTTPNKNSTGTPVQVFIDRQVAPTLYVWPVPTSDDYSLVFDKIIRLDDAAEYTNTMEVPFRFIPCLVAGLAYYIAMKRAPDRVELLKAVYEEEFQRASDEDRDRASLRITPGGGY